MTPRQRRMTLVIGVLAGVSIAGALALSAFRQNVTFFFDPTQVAAGQVHTGEHFRLGGMVTEGSVHRSPGSLEVRFVVTDFKNDVPVTYTGVLPDLFREGTGVVAHGRLNANGTFVADEVLAKHDEKYMPPEVARSLKRRHGESRADAADTQTQSAASPNGSSGAPGERPASGPSATLQAPAVPAPAATTQTAPTTNAPSSVSAPAPRSAQAASPTHQEGT